MNKVIIDSSALLALINNEQGSAVVEGLLGNILMSSVNISEVASILLDSQMNTEQVTKAIEPFIDTIIDFDLDYSILCGSLKKSTKHLGLSFGDRACIALGIKLGLPIYTADKIWTELNLENLDIRLIR